MNVLSRRGSRWLFLTSGLLLASLVVIPAGAQEQDGCTLIDSEVRCVGQVDTPQKGIKVIMGEDKGDPPEWFRVFVIDHDRKVENQGSLKMSHNTLSVGAFVWGPDNQLVNEQGARIESEGLEIVDLPGDPPVPISSPFAPAVGVWMRNSAGSDGTADGQPHLQNHGEIEARGGTGRDFLWGGGIAYTSGVLLEGHNASILNKGIIRGVQVDNGTGDDDRFVGVFSHWALIPEEDVDPTGSTSLPGADGKVDPSANRIENAGTIEARGHRATGVLLKSNPSQGAVGDPGYQHRLVNSGGIIKAGGVDDEAGDHAQEAIGVDVEDGYARVDNRGAVEAIAERDGGLAIGVRAAGSAVDITNGDASEPLGEGGGVGSLDSDGSNSPRIVATASNGQAIGVSLKGTDSTFENKPEAEVGAEGKSALGIQITGSNNRVINEGIVEGVRRSGDVVAAAGGGSAERVAGIALDGEKGRVENKSQGTVRGSGDGAIGVDMQGLSGLVENAGLIAAEGNKVVGVYMQGENGEVQNTGRIEAKGHGAVGVRVAGQGNSLVNQRGGVIRTEDEGSIGVEVLWNSQMASLPLNNEGKIQSEKGTGVLVRVEEQPSSEPEGDSSPEIRNSGSIVGSSAGVHVAFSDPGGDTKVVVRNLMNGEIRGTGDVAIRATDETGSGAGTGGVRLLNEGTIRGNVELLNGGNHEITSEGAGSSIKGNLLLGSGNDVVKIQNSGTGAVGRKAVEGSIDLGGGDDFLKVDGSWLEGIMTLGSGDDMVEILGSQITSGADEEADDEDIRVLIHLGSGNDTLRVDTQVRIYGFADGGRSDSGDEENTLELTGDGTGQLLGVQNFNQIKVQGGQWEFGQLSVGAGEELEVTGVLTAGVVWLAPDSTLNIAKLVVNDVSIYNQFAYSGLLTGSGTIVGNLTMQGGRVSPGTGKAEDEDDEPDIGTLTIQGNYVQGSNATYVVDVLPQQEGEQFGQSDRIVITGSGTALFEEGSRIYVNAARGSYNPKNEYRILEGQLDAEMDDARLASLRVETNRPFLKGSLRVGSLILVVEKDFTGPAQTPNQKAVGEALSEAPAGALGPLEDALMDITDGNEARDALDQLSGEIYTTYLGVGESSMGQFMRLITRGMDLPVPVEDNKIWADVYSHFSRVDSTRENAHWELQQTGVVFGFGRDTSERARLGLFGGFNRSWVNMPARRSESTGDGFQLGAYGRYRGTMGSLTGIVAYAQGRHDVERNIRIRDYRTTAKGRVEERALAVAVEGRLHYTISGFQVEPLLGLTWMDLNQASLRESSGDVARLRISEASANVFRGTLGVRVGTHPAGTGVWPEFLLAWINDFHDLPREVEAEFLAVPGYPFTVQGTKVGRSAILAGVSIEGVRANGMTWQLGYRGEFRDNRSVHTGMLSFHFPL